MSPSSNAARSSARPAHETTILKGSQRRQPTQCQERSALLTWFRVNHQSAGGCVCGVQGRHSRCLPPCCTKQRQPTVQNSRTDGIERRRHSGCGATARASASLRACTSLSWCALSDAPHAPCHLQPIACTMPLHTPASRKSRLDDALFW